MAEHEAVIGAQVGELLPAIARHLADQRALAVDHLVMGERQDEVLAEGVDQAEGQLVVMVLAIDRVLADVAQRVVHPAHVPFVAEAEAAEIGRQRHARPGGQFLGHRRRALGLGVGELVEAPQERDRVEVLVAAVDVGDPLARLPRVVEVEHRGDRIDAQAVDVVVPEPEQGVGQQEVRDLAPPVVVDQGVPVAMEAEARIGVLVEMGAVELAEAVRVGREMARHPIEQEADPALVAAVDEARELLGHRRGGWSARTGRSAGSPRSRRTGTPRPAAARDG